MEVEVSTAAAHRTRTLSSWCMSLWTLIIEDVLALEAVTTPAHIRYIIIISSSHLLMISYLLSLQISISAAALQLGRKVHRLPMLKIGGRIHRVTSRPRPCHSSADLHIISISAASAAAAYYLNYTTSHIAPKRKGQARWDFGKCRNKTLLSHLHLWSDWTSQIDTNATFLRAHSSVYQI